MVWINNVRPIARGCFIFMKIKLKINKNVISIHCIISRNSLIKILILGINDKEFLFSWSFKRIDLIFDLQDQCFIKLLKLMLMILYYILPSILFIIGVFTFVLNRKHLLSILLSLEYIVLVLFLLLYIYLNILNYERFFRIIFLTFRVCEGALGLSILVSIIRTHGNDYFQRFNILQC